MSRPLRAGELASAAGVHRQTLRYYERIGLLAEPDRTLGGHRQYPAADVVRLTTIKSLQQLGFPLAEIRQLLGARRSPASLGDPALTARADAKIADIDRRIAELTAIRQTLVEARDAGCTDLLDCDGNPACPLPLSTPQIRTRRD